VAVAAGLLVRFHNHSDQGEPIVLLPERNENNKWTYSQNGYLIHDDEYAGTMVALKAEGIYRSREHFHPASDQVVAKDALVQLGYNRHAEPIIFFPRVLEAENALAFPTTGTKINDKIYALLEPLDLRGPYVPKARLH
jgi:hypothetical protein